MNKKEVIAMILAGGQGSRLKQLTKSNAKPAVEFGGKYRIIDFTLSNCSNSSIDVVGVLTQYQPLILHTHIGIGAPWDLDRTNGGVSLLPPHVTDIGGNWYKGTADAIYQNMYFIEQFSPEYLLVLSGDHIYKMNYLNLLNYHKNKKADVTIAVIEVPIEEAHRFGIMNVDEKYKIYQFEEKPKKPKSNLASMGIYIFNWKKLKVFLEEDQKDELSSHDFGKNIIPKMLNSGLKLFAYPFNGYWKDVGTIESYWEANMDLINESSGIDGERKLNLFDNDWRIYSAPQTYPPHYVGNSAKIQRSLIVEGCTILGSVINSVLSYGVYIGSGAVVKKSVVLSNAVIEDGAIVENAVICSNATVKKGSKVIGDNKIEVISEGKVVYNDAEMI